jgi:hypothetical protein
VPTAALPELANADQALGAAKARGRPARASRALDAGHPPLLAADLLLQAHPAAARALALLPSGRSFPSGPTQRRYSLEPPALQSLAREPELPAPPAPGRVHRPAARQGARRAPRERPVRPLAVPASGLYDRSLVIVTADNGENFGRLGNGREISRRNAADIALTPLIAKLPGEHSGRIARRHVRTIDVLPTIARIAHMSIPGGSTGFPCSGPPPAGSHGRRCSQALRAAPAAELWVARPRRRRLAAPEAAPVRLRQRASGAVSASARRARSTALRSPASRCCLRTAPAPPSTWPAATAACPAPRAQCR